MPTYQALTPSTHRGKRWKRYTDYRFAAADTLAPLVGKIGDRPRF